MSLIIDGSNGLTFPNSTTQASAGQVLQVVNATYGTQVSNASTSAVDTNLTATITPKFATSKILVIVNQNGNTCNTTGLGTTYTLLRGSSVITTFAVYYNAATTNDSQDATTSYLDSPATTSATTYKTQFVKTQANAGTCYCQISSACTSTITLMEIAQ